MAMERDVGAVTHLQGTPPPESALPHEGRRRVAIEAVAPEIDGGRFAVKRTVGEVVRVEADILANGHDAVRGLLLHRHESEPAWTETEMAPLGNDRHWGEFAAGRLGEYRYTLAAWVDRFDTWLRDTESKLGAGQDVSLDLLAGAGLLEQRAVPAAPSEARTLSAGAERLRLWAGAAGPPEGPVLDERTAEIARRYPDRSRETVLPRELRVVVDPALARYSSWYELFPRSTGEAGRHGTFADVERQLPRLAELGFDVLYLPPIHPIGRTKRKGPNNAVAAGAGAGAPGSPWGIGSAEGGHLDVHPQLGTLADFRRLVERARDHGIQVALDIAFQCSPDHPWVREHPEWFRHRPDGTVQFAENPPKRYEDIYPLDFESEDWQALWRELLGVFLHWIAQGVGVFRVDNPHTKPFPFWEWVIAEVKRRHPQAIFLSEAFTRPKVVRRLAKIGFTQSYTYFAWRNTRSELTEYFTELAKSESREYLRPNAWPNTPDILTEYLQLGGRPAFVARLVLAATLAASYGIYGPAFELCVATPAEPGSEEYLDSEKYALRAWEVDRAAGISEIVAAVNRIRRENPALQQDWTLEFHGSDNDQLLCYSKTSPDGSNAVLCVVNLDPHHVQSGWVELRLDVLGLDRDPFQVDDLLGGGRFLWQGARNYVELDPRVLPAHVFAVRRRLRTERDFDYFQ